MLSSKEVHAALGATHPAASEQITLFIPGKDREGRAIDQDRWTDEALGVLGRLFRGATAFPPGKGVWRDDEKGGRLLREATVVIICYAAKAELHRNLQELRAFLHRMGRETGQGEIGIAINDDYHGISEYDSE